MIDEKKIIESKKQLFYTVEEYSSWIFEIDSMIILWGHCSASPWDFQSHEQDPGVTDLRFGL